MKKIYASLLLCCAINFVNAQWTSDRKQNTHVANANASDIQTANTNDGRTWIAFYSQRGNNYDMRAQLLNANGERMLGDSGVLVSDKQSGSATFVFNVCVDKENNLIVAFQFLKNGNYQCVIQKINTAGKRLWDGGVKLGAGLSPYPVTLATNKIAVAWNNNNKIDYQIINPSGTTAWATYKEYAANGVSRPQLLANTNGGFSMVYQSLVYFPFYTNLYEQRFDSTGNTVWSAPSKISSLTTASYRYFDVHIDGDTTYVAYYGNPSGSNRFDAYVQKINNKGKILWGVNGSAFADYSGEFDPYEQTIYMAKGKNSNDVWAVCTITNYLQTTSGVYSQKFDANTGQRLLKPNGQLVVPMSSHLGSLAFSKLSLCYGDLPIFIIKSDNNILAAMKLNIDGKPIWRAPVDQLLATSNNAKFRYGFTDVYNGQAVAVWQEDKGNGDMPYAQNIKCDGSTGSSSNNFIANTSITNSISIKNIFPNPVHGILNATIESRAKTSIHIYVTDVAGNIIKQFQQNISAGANTVQLNLDGVKTGSYFMKVTNEKESAGVIFNKD